VTTAVPDAPHRLMTVCAAAPSAPVTNGGDRVEAPRDRGHQQRAHRQQSDGRGPKPAFARSACRPGGRRGCSDVSRQVRSAADAVAASSCLGVTISRDPLDGQNGTPVVANPYHYTDNDPINKTDPTGMSTTTDSSGPFSPAGTPVWGQGAPSDPLCELIRSCRKPQPAVDPRCASPLPTGIPGRPREGFNCPPSNVAGPFPVCPFFLPTDYYCTPPPPVGPSPPQVPIPPARVIFSSSWAGSSATFSPGLSKELATKTASPLINYILPGAVSVVVGAICAAVITPIAAGTFGMPWIICTWVSLATGIQAGKILFDISTAASSDGCFVVNYYSLLAVVPLAAISSAWIDSTQGDCPRARRGDH